MWHLQKASTAGDRGTLNRSRMDGTTLTEALVAMGLASVVLASGLVLQLRLSQGVQQLGERTQALWFLDGLQARLQVAYPERQGAFRLEPGPVECTDPPEDLTLSLSRLLNGWYREVQCALPGASVTVDLASESREFRIFWPADGDRTPVVLKSVTGVGP